jgi:hypothetical protein
MIESMNISRLMPFLSLMLLLPASSSAALVFPRNQQPTLNPSELCPLVQIVEHELCANHTLHDLGGLLHNYDTAFCSGEKEKEKENFVTKPISYDVMSVRVLEHEYNNHVKDIRRVCPIINFIEQELCTSHNKELHARVRFDPKELCPLLNLTYTEICE